jgi:hypothetical protein
MLKDQFNDNSGVFCFIPAIPAADSFGDFSIHAGEDYRDWWERVYNSPRGWTL